MLRVSRDTISLNNSESVMLLLNMLKVSRYHWKCRRCHNIARQWWKCHDIAKYAESVTISLNNTESVTISLDNAESVTTNYTCAMLYHIEGFHYHCCQMTMRHANSLAWQTHLTFCECYVVVFRLQHPFLLKNFFLAEKYKNSFHKVYLERYVLLAVCRN